MEIFTYGLANVTELVNEIHSRQKHERGSLIGGWGPTARAGASKNTLIQAAPAEQNYPSPIYVKDRLDHPASKTENMSLGGFLS
jgi:hypothetical protein